MCFVWVISIDLASIHEFFSHLYLVLWGFFCFVLFLLETRCGRYSGQSNTALQKLISHWERKCIGEKCVGNLGSKFYEESLGSKFYEEKQNKKKVYVRK